MRETLDAMWLRLSEISPTYALLALGVYVGSHLVAALRLRAVVVGMDLSMRRRDAFIANVCSTFVNNVTPGRVGGEICRAVLLNRRSRIDLARATVALGYDRLTDIVPVAMMLLATIPILRKLLPEGVSSGRRAALLGLGLSVLIALAAGLLRSTRGRSFVERWRDHFLRFRVQGRAMARAVALSALLFAMDLARLLLVALAFGVHLGPEQAIVLSVVGVVGGLIPTPGGLGAIEGGLAAALVLFGVPLDKALAATLFERGLSYWLGGAAGGVVMLLVGGRGLWRAVRGGPLR